MVKVSEVEQNDSAIHTHVFMLPQTPLRKGLISISIFHTFMFTISQSLLKFMPTESMMLSNHLILCHPLLLLPSVFPSITVFSNDSALCVRWPKYWSFRISPSNDYSELISFRTYWFTSLLSKGLSRIFSSTTI